MIDKSVADNILSLAMSNKADAAEVFFRSSISTNVEVKDQKIEAFERARDIGAGLRILAGGGLGFAFTTDISNAALERLALNAVTNAKSTEPDPFNALPARPAGPYREAAIYDHGLIAVTEEEQIDRAMALEREALAVDPRIKRIRKASLRLSSSETVIVNSNGVTVSYRGTSGSSSIEVVAEDRGESQAGWDFDISRFFDKLEIEAVGRRAARKALDLLGARNIPSVKTAVIIDRTVAEELLSIIASGFSAENVQKKKSLFIGKLGQSVLSPLITVKDDGLREGGIGTAPADDEGVPMSAKTVVEKGTLAMYLYNTYTANKDRTNSTGNAVRGGFKGVPGVGVTNLFIEPAKLTPEEVISGTGKGLYVMEIMGAHTANPISGDFSVGATGFWIEKGKIAYPVREVTIAGNILDVMKNIDAVCGDLRFAGKIGSPTLRIRDLSVAGK